MKKALTAILLVLAASMALALPAPNDIAAAVNSGHLSQAEAMLHEVIREKPGSAKAHYELGQVLVREGRNTEARQELLEARRIEPSLKFASDPQRFNDLLNRIAVTSPAPIAKASEPTLHPVVNAAPAPVFPWAYLILGGGAMLLLWLFFRRKTTAPPMMPVATAPGGGAGPGGGFGYGAASYSPPQASGSGVGGAVLGGIAGLAAGYGLAKVLENGTDSHRTQNANDSNGFIPIEPNPSVDSGAFDAGAGDSWDTGDTSSSSDDSW